MEDVNHFDYVEELCKKYNLNIFHKIALSNADYAVDGQCIYVAKELEKLGVDSLAISGFIKAKQMEEMMLSWVCRNENS